MTTLVDAPARVDGVQLIGDMVGSGYRTPPALVRRSDGQVLQLTPLLYRVLDAADGRHSCDDIAELISRDVGRGVSGADVRALVDRHLRPLGLVRGLDGSAPVVRRSDPLLGLKPRFAVTDPRTTRRLTDPFRVLFEPILAAPVVLGFVAVVGWVFFERGLAASTYDAFERPHLLLLVFAVSVLSAGFHEFGHAAAARRGGAQPGVMGAGLYLVWPAFYTDVTDSYRLDRVGRLRTDLGGLYFNAIVVVLTFGWWWVSGAEALLLLVATQVMQMVQQLLPMLRFDGYHVLSDLAGVPDLYQRIRPTLRGLLPQHWNSPENRMLTPWARVVITLWVLVTVPMLALMLLGLISVTPRLLGTGWHVVRADATAVAEAWHAVDVLDLAAHVVQILAVALPMIGCVLILARLGWRCFGAMAGWSRGSTTKRAIALAAGTVLITGLSWAWWPHPGTYAPIEPGERGLLTSLLPVSASEDRLERPAVGLPAVEAGAAARERLAAARSLTATFPEDGRLPTRQEPALAMVLVPTGGAKTEDRAAGASVSQWDGTWVFPFDQPLPPEAGDNQALAVNLTDGSVTYDVAFALVWVRDDEVLNVNEAHAYASCTDCVTVAVAFQVVLVMTDAHVVVPQNLAVAANYDCYACITVALASQLVLSVGEEPGDDQLHALSEVWVRLVALGQSITSYSLADLSAQLEAVKAEIVEILDAAPVLDPSTSSSSPAPVETATPAPTSPTSEPSSGSSASPTATSPTPTAEPEPTATEEPAPSTAPTSQDAESSPTVTPSP